MLTEFPKSIHDYCAEHTVRPIDYLDRIEASTIQNVHGASMISGAYQGRLLSFISNLVRPKYVLEIGTFTGYSALCLAEGLVEGGKILTIERNEQLAPLIEEHLSWSPYQSQIEVLFGQAESMIPTLDFSWDLIFIDAAKKQYQNYVDLVIDRMNSGGVIIADNVLWRGKVLDSEDEDQRTQAMRRFNQSMAKDQRLEPFMMPIRDGIFLLRKK